MADEKIEKVARIKQEYLSDALLFLTYMIRKSEVDDKETKWQEQRRKAMRGK